jgi:hypothetical protein
VGRGARRGTRSRLPPPVGAAVACGFAIRSRKGREAASDVVASPTESLRYHSPLPRRSSIPARPFSCPARFRGKNSSLKPGHSVNPSATAPVGLFSDAADIPLKTPVFVL